MSHRPPIWYFDKIAGAVVVVTGIGLVLLALIVWAVTHTSNAPQAFLGFVLFLLLCAGVCLYTGVMLLKRSGQR